MLCRCQLCFNTRIGDPTPNAGRSRIAIVKSLGFVDTGLFGSEESTMGKTKSSLPAEVRRRRHLVRAGRSPEELAREFEPYGTVDQELVGTVEA